MYITIYSVILFIIQWEFNKEIKQFRKTNNVNFLTYRIDGNNQKEIDYKQFGSPAFLVLFISRGVVNTNEIIFVDAWGSNNIVAGSSSYVQILVDNNMITIKNDSDAGVNCIAMIGYNSI